KQIGGRAARQRAPAARGGDAIRPREQRGLGGRLLPEHPRLARAPPPLQAHPPRRAIVPHPPQAPGPYPPPPRGAPPEHPQREPARLQPAVAPNRRGRKRDGLLGDEVDTAVSDLLQDARSLLRLEHRTENLPSFAMARQLAEKGRCDHHLVEPIDNLVAR